MASEQLRRENKIDEREIHVEKDKVPKMASHFESLTVKESGDQSGSAAVVQHVTGTTGDTAHGEKRESKQVLESVPGKKGGVELAGGMHGQSETQKEQGRAGEAQNMQGTTLHRTEGEKQKNTTASGGDVEQQRGKNIQSRGEETEKQSGTTTESMQAGKKESEERDQPKGPSLEEISKYRGTAQQNSMEAIRAAEKRYQKAKEMGTSPDQNVRKSAGPQTGQQTEERATGTAAEKAARAKDYTLEKGQQTGQQAKESLSGATQTAAEKAARAKDYAIQKGQQTGQQARESLSAATQAAAEKAARVKDYALEKGQQTGQQTKESLSEATQTAMEKAAMAKDYTLEKSGQAKDVVAEKASGLTDTAVDASKKGACYVGEKAVTAKDIAIETGKTTAGYVGKVAEVVKDKAVVAGWSAAEFASEKAVGVTETVANVTAGVAGYAGDTAVATKDVLANVGTKTKEFTGEKLAAAKDAVVATEESAKEYAARRRAEKVSELEAKSSSQPKAEGELVGQTNEARSGGDVDSDSKRQVIETNKGYDERGGEGYEESFEHQTERGSSAGGGAGGMICVIGETLVEIGQNTKEMLVGQGGYEGKQQLGEGVESKEGFKNVNE